MYVSQWAVLCVCKSVSSVVCRSLYVLPAGRIVRRPLGHNMTSWRLCAGGGISGWTTSCECLLTAWCAARCWQWAVEGGRPTNRAACSWTQHCRWTNGPCCCGTNQMGTRWSLHPPTTGKPLGGAPLSTTTL